MKKEKPNILWAIDAKGNEYTGQSAPYSYYEIHKCDGLFVAMYYGVVAVHDSDTLEEAKEYIFNKIKSGRY